MFLIVLGVLFVIFVVECLLLEVEHWGAATITLIATAVGLQIFHVTDIWGFMLHHTLDAVIYVLAYLATGVVWSFIKWFSFLIQFRDKFHEVRDDWHQRNNVQVGAELTTAQEIELNRVLQWDSYGGQDLGHKPKAVKNKRRIVAWMAYWPFSVIGTLINDPIRRLFRFLFNSFKALYQRIADHVFRNEVGLKQ